MKFSNDSSVHRWDGGAVAVVVNLLGLLCVSSITMCVEVFDNVRLLLVLLVRYNNR